MLNISKKRKQRSLFVVYKQYFPFGWKIRFVIQCRKHLSLYLLLSPAGDSAPSMHLSSWLATICRSSSSSRVSRSNWSSWGKTFTAVITTPHPPWHGNLSLLFKTYLMPVRIKCKTQFVFGLHDLKDFSPAASLLSNRGFKKKSLTVDSAFKTLKPCPGPFNSLRFSTKLGGLSREW